MKRILIGILSLIMIASCFVFTTSATGETPEEGAFIFDSTESLTNLGLVRNLDMIYDADSTDLKLTVNTTDTSVAPRVLLKITAKNLYAKDYGYAVITYKCPTTVSSNVNQLKVYIDAGDVKVPTEGYSASFSVQKTGEYVSQIVSLCDLAWWKNQIYSLRFDILNSPKDGDTIYLDSVIFCKDLGEAYACRTQRSGVESVLDKYNSTYYSLSYDVTKYTTPFWKGNIVYNEAVYPIVNKDGSTTYRLMYAADEVITVTNATMNEIYTEGVDYTVSGNTITFLKTGSISIKPYTYLHPTNDMIPAGYSGWSPYYKRHAAGDGMYEYHTAEVAKQYINVTYTHSDTWTGPVPEQSSSSLPRTADAITNKGTLNIVYYGDSICGGARASSYQNLYPYAEYWNQQITSKLRQDYGVTVNEQISSVGGSDAVTMSDSSKVSSYVNAYSPDLVFIEFGVNDAQNYAVGGESTSSLKKAYKDAIISIIDQVREKKSTCEFVLVAPYYSNIYDFKAEYFDVCRDACVEIAETTSGTAVANVTVFHDYLIGIKNYADFTGDNLCHPNDYMSRIFSQICLETIVPGGVSPYNYTSDTPEEPEVIYEKGDVNKDGKITAVDANLIIKALSGIITLEDETLGDMNDDGKVSSADINILSQKILGIV